MKKMVIVFIFLITLNAYGTTIEEQATELQKLDERLTDIELRTIKDKINFGIDLKIDTAFMRDKAKISGQNATSKNGILASLLFRLNADTKIGEHLSIFASAESLSFFNDNLFTNKTFAEGRENQFRGDKLIISKAYFDWKFYSDWLILTAGRLPTTQGPPTHLKDGVERLGTYPSTAYSVPLDGFALTAKLSSPLNLKNNLSTRIIYSPGILTTDNFPFRGANLGDPTKPERVAKGHNLTSAMLEYEDVNSSNGIWKKMLAILQLGYFQFSAPQGVMGTGITGASDYDLYRIYFDSDKYITAKEITPYLEFNKIFNTQLDYYITFSWMVSESFANAKAVKITGTGSGTTIPLGAALHPGKRNGTRLVTGTRYEFSNKYFLGFEYLKSSDNSFPTTFHSNYILNTNYFNGNSYEIYALKNLYNDNFIIRTSYTHLNITADISNGFFFQNVVEAVDVVALTFNLKI